MAWKPDPNDPDVLMKTFFSSDHHFMHANIIQYDSRPFQSVEEMNEEMIRRWNAVVKPDDRVIYLGDFSLSKAALVDILPKLTPTHIVEGREPRIHHMSASKNRRKERSRTYPGIAQAMAEQWGGAVVPGVQR